MEKTELLSVKEFAKLTGVTEQAVYKRLRSENSELKTFVVERGGKKYLKCEALETVQEKRTVEKAESETLREMVNLLKQQLADARKDLEDAKKEKDVLLAQNKELTAALENTTASLQAAQALHAGTIQQRIGTAQESEPEAPETAQKRKKGFFSRFFS